MKAVIFTGNQPRHLSLLADFADVCTEVFAVLECSTVFPGQEKDFFDNSPAMRAYFERVIQAENEVFGRPRFLPSKVRTLALKGGDLGKLDLAVLQAALDADVFVVFGSSYIKGALCDALVERRAVNIHVGVSPYYRGSSCNFWALYDGRPEMVGGTVHLLSKGLDSGPILFHALPKPQAVNPFEYGMLAVRATSKALMKKVVSNGLLNDQPVPQNRKSEIRYSKKSAFTDEIVIEYLRNVPSSKFIFEKTRNRDNNLYVYSVIV